MRRMPPCWRRMWLTVVSSSKLRVASLRERPEEAVPSAPAACSGMLDAAGGWLERAPGTRRCCRWRCSLPWSFRSAPPAGPGCRSCGSVPAGRSRGRDPPPPYSCRPQHRDQDGVNFCLYSSSCFCCIANSLRVWAERGSWEPELSRRPFWSVTVTRVGSRP